MNDRPRRVIAWFRRDLRLSDNRMLAAAADTGAMVYPVFVADPQALARNASAHARVAWFAASVRDLGDRLRERGSGLVILAGEPAIVLRAFAARIGADTAFAARDEEPWAVARDLRVGSVLDLQLVDDQRLVPPGELLTRAGEPFRVFTPFRRALDRRLEAEGDMLVAEAAANLSCLAPSAKLPAGDAFVGPATAVRLPHPGDAAAAARLHDFERMDLRRYREERDRPDLDCTSRISPYLRVGALSVRAAWRAALAAEGTGRRLRDGELQSGARRWRDELAWREFYAAVLHGHPHVTERSFRAEYGGIAWEQGAWADGALQAWRDGQTGYPIVDAAMRQLRETGWMHNRLRMITASFLVKDLGIDWRRGEATFMEHLLDGDVAQNNGNWQWVAGVGTDAAPYFRVLNPTVQGRRFDPDGAFVRTWLPELENVPSQYLHEPWLAPADRRPAGYPEPIVDHRAARLRALARYAGARAS